MFIFDDNKSYRMPPFFGVQDWVPDFEVPVNDVLSLAFTITTDRCRIVDYLPEGFELLKPELNIKYSQIREAEFLHGGAYNLIQIDVPARFTGKQDQLEGSFPLVIWENNTRPIISGREESGQPKIYADIEDIHIFGNKYYTNASYDGYTFLKLEMLNPQSVDAETLEQIKAVTANYNVFGWRYIPKVGTPGADLSQPILYPQSLKVHSAWTGKGSVQWIKLSDDYQYVDPAHKYSDNINYYEIISQLADLPVKAVSPVSMAKGTVIMRPYSGRVLK